MPYHYQQPDSDFVEDPEFSKRVADLLDKVYRDMELLQQHAGHYPLPTPKNDFEVINLLEHVWSLYLGSSREELTYLQKFFKF